MVFAIQRWLPPTSSQVDNTKMLHQQSRSAQNLTLQPTTAGLTPQATDFQARISLILDRHRPEGTSASLSAVSTTFNSLSRVVFIFPSRYLFAIGLPLIFSFGWSLPPILGLCSQIARLLEVKTYDTDNTRLTGLLPSMASRSRELRWGPYLEFTR